MASTLDTDGLAAHMHPFTEFALKWTPADAADRAAVAHGSLALYVLDQTLLPTREEWRHVPDGAAMYDCIKEMRVRGAPMIAICACMALSVAARGGGATVDDVRRLCARLLESRPTAVNLANAIAEVRALLDAADAGGDAWRQAVCDYTRTLIVREKANCDQMAARGVALMAGGGGGGGGEMVMTICNTGSLGTVGVGTALGVIRRAAHDSRLRGVYALETRPYLQGARLTTYELQRAGIPVTLVCDSVAGSLMAAGRVSRVFVGADRIARNGDTANKVGTYTLAVLARHHGVPFHVVAPMSTVDGACADGGGIPIEQRAGAEVRGVTVGPSPGRWVSADVEVYNPAFDVTPMALITSIVTDTGVFVADADASAEHGTRPVSSMLDVL